MQLFQYYSCIGLIGIVSYATAKRKKEISVRKVFGASSLNILRMINNQFVKLIIYGLVFMNSISYFVVNKWLNSFVYHTNLEVVDYFNIYFIDIIYNYTCSKYTIL